MTTRVLYLADLKSGDLSPIATFELDKANKLKTSWEDGMDWYREGIEDAGIVADGKVYFPKDGKRFFDALPKAFSNSSTMQVKDA